MLIASGGGTRNATLMRRLEARLPDGLVTTSDEFGIPPEFKEAIQFATLAHATVNHLANNIPAASGATSFGISGRFNCRRVSAKRLRRTPKAPEAR